MSLGGFFLQMFMYILLLISTYTYCTLGHRFNCIYFVKKKYINNNNNCNLFRSDLSLLYLFCLLGRHSKNNDSSSFRKYPFGQHSQNKSKFDYLLYLYF